MRGSIWRATELPPEAHFVFVSSLTAHTQAKRPPNSERSCLAGDEGFEPPNAGTRTQCLTTWRIPNMSGLFYVFADLFCNVLVPNGTNYNLLGRRTSDSRCLTAWPIPSSVVDYSEKGRFVQACRWWSWTNG